jgi:hypothetical protein
MVEAAPFVKHSAHLSANPCAGNGLVTPCCYGSSPNGGLHMTATPKTIGFDATCHYRSQLADRIENVTRSLPGWSAHRIAGEIDDIRRAATEHGLATVARLAHVLEHRLGEAGGAITALPFLEAMRDAVHIDTSGEDMSSLYLAALGQRFNG